MSEQRIRNNRLRRQRERRRHIWFLAVTASLIITVSFLTGSFLSNAKERQSQTAYKYYTSILIHEGDTLWSIARLYMDAHYDSEEAYIRELKQINALEDDHIRTGMYLVVPYYAVE